MPTDLCIPDIETHESSAALPYQAPNESMAYKQQNVGRQLCVCLFGPVLFTELLFMMQVVTHGNQTAPPRLLFFLGSVRGVPRPPPFDGSIKSRTA